jgi:hypothetical protein
MGIMMFSLRVIFKTGLQILLLLKLLATASLGEELVT